MNSKLSTNSYASALKILVPHRITKVLVHLKEENTNAVKVKVLASVDDVVYETIKPETVLAKNGSAYETVTDPWMWLDVQFCASVADAQGKLTVTITGVG